MSWFTQYKYTKIVQWKFSKSSHLQFNLFSSSLYWTDSWEQVNPSIQDISLSISRRAKTPDFKQFRYCSQSNDLGIANNHNLEIFLKILLKIIKYPLNLVDISSISQGLVRNVNSPIIFRSGHNVTQIYKVEGCPKLLVSVLYPESRPTSCFCFIQFSFQVKYFSALC